MAHRAGPTITNQHARSSFPFKFVRKRCGDLRQLFPTAVRARDRHLLYLRPAPICQRRCCDLRRVTHVFPSKLCYMQGPTYGECPLDAEDQQLILFVATRGRQPRPRQRALNHLRTHSQGILPPGQTQHTPQFGLKYRPQTTHRPGEVVRRRDEVQRRHV